jgi:hypothetical protein
LAKEQENILIENGYEAVEFKTRNYLKPMIVFALKHGFDIVNLILKDNPPQHHLILRKQLIHIKV